MLGPYLEFSSHIWSPQYKYLIDKIESVQRCFINRLFTRKLSGLSKLSYFPRLKILGLETLERRRLINDLVLYYKILNGHCNLVLNVAPSSCVTHGNYFKLSEQTCSIDVSKFFNLIELWTHGTVYLILFHLHHQLEILKWNFMRLILISDYRRMILFLYLSLFFSVLYCILCVFYMCFSSISVAVWPFVAYLKWN